MACDTHKSQKLAFKTVMVTAITIILSRPPLAALDHKVGSVWVLAKRSPHAGILEGLFCGDGANPSCCYRALAGDRWWDPLLS